MESRGEMVYTAAALEKVNGVAALVEQTVVATTNGRNAAGWPQAEAIYATFFEDNPDLLFITGYDGLLLDINPAGCQLLQQPKEGFIGRSLALIAPRLKPFLAQQAGRLKGWAEAVTEIDLNLVQRPRLSLKIKARQISYKDQNAVEWAGFDISARPKTEELRQDMVAMLVHDLRGPLGNLLNVIELIGMLLKSDKSLDHARIIKLLEMGRHSGQTIRELVDSVLEVSWLEQGKAPLQRALINLNRLLQAVQEQLLPQATVKKMNLAIQPVPETAEVWLDSHLIQRVLLNLLGNAIKYTPNEGHISLAVELTTEALHFTVADDGPGIKKADQGHIFDKFSRVDYSANAPAGVGLGLAFCKLAVEAHQGRITVESEGIPGQGSAFHIAIPLRQPAGN